MTGRDAMIYSSIACFALVLFFFGAKVKGLAFGGMFGGQVLEQDSGSPIAEVYVFATWRDSTLNRLSCIHKAIDISEDDGEYYFGPWVDVVGHSVFDQKAPTIFAYKPGYEQVKADNGDVYIQRHEERPAGRIDRIYRLSNELCGDESSRTAKLKTEMLRAMYLEAKEELKDVAKDDEEESHKVEELRERAGVSEHE